MEITINVSPMILEKATQYAIGNGSNIEEMVDNYIKLLATHDNKNNPAHSAIARALKGVVHSQQDISQLLNEDIQKNHQQ